MPASSPEYPTNASTKSSPKPKNAVATISFDLLLRLAYSKRPPIATDGTNNPIEVFDLLRINRATDAIRTASQKRRDVRLNMNHAAMTEHAAAKPAWFLWTKIPRHAPTSSRSVSPNWCLPCAERRPANRLAKTTPARNKANNLVVRSPPKTRTQLNTERITTVTSMIRRNAISGEADQARETKHQASDGKSQGPTVLRNETPLYVHATAPINPPTKRKAICRAADPSPELAVSTSDLSESGSRPTNDRSKSAKNSSDTSFEREKAKPTEYLVTVSHRIHIRCLTERAVGLPDLPGHQ